MMHAVVLVLGVAFGYVLSRGGATDYDYIQRMFLFESPQLYFIIGGAVAVVMPGLVLLRKLGKTITGQPLVIKPKPRHLGNVFGGVLFGVGWSVTGMCPGPVLVNIGEGKLYAWPALLGALAGAYLLGVLYPHLVGPLRLPPLKVGPGNG
ncbi:MAG: YeeE/YedE family protein [Deltaproteobacteria bacterium]|nr:YeeE/YedE family protein [Deltaproteobacteria bacterium]